MNVVTGSCTPNNLYANEVCNHPTLLNEIGEPQLFQERMSISGLFYRYLCLKGRRSERHFITDSQ